MVFLTWNIHQCSIPSLSEVWRWKDDTHLAAVDVCVLPPQTIDGHVHFAGAYITPTEHFTLCHYLGI